MYQKPKCRKCYHSEGSHYTMECSGSPHCGCTSYESDFKCRICGDTHYEQVVEVQGIHLYRCWNCSVIFCYPDSFGGLKYGT